MYPFPSRVVGGSVHESQYESDRKSISGIFDVGNDSEGGRTHDVVVYETKNRTYIERPTRTGDLRTNFLELNRGIPPIHGEKAESCEF